MKNYLYFFLLFLYVMGMIGGIGYSCYNGVYVITLAVAVLAVMAFPTAKKMWNFLMR